MPNGARIGFTGTAPTSSSPVTNCTVQAGAPVLIKWLYNTSTSNTYFTVTWQDRTVWTTTSSTSGYGGGSWQLAQITDRNGNSIYFNYGTTQYNGYTVLNSISSQAAGAGTQLLTIVRNTYGHIVSVTDCYGRSVYYYVLPGGEPQSSAVDFVSQIVPSCSGSVPVRYEYGYQWFSNSEGYHSAPFLHTISVPSPTGTGMSTATINYTTATGAPYVASLVDANGNTRTYTQVNGLNTQVTVTNPSGQTVYSYTGTFDNNMSDVAVTDGTGQLYSQAVYSDPNDPYRPSATLNAIAARATISSSSIYIGYSGTEAKSGSDLPTTGTWQVVSSSGTLVGSSTTTNGWAVTYNSGTTSFTISIPTSGIAGTGYEVKYASVGSAIFNVLSSSTTGSGITNFTWDQYGNNLTEISPREVTTTNTYSHVNFALGELLSTQESYVSGGTTYYKTATSYTYDDSDGYNDTLGNFHPCGLVISISSPTPGTSGGSGEQVATTYTYDLTGQGAKSMGNLGLGNIITIAEPGNNAATSSTTAFNYTTDGAYSQSQAVNQPVTVTDNLGNVIHVRYDSRSNLSAIKDPLGNETDFTYSLANQLLTTTYPQTGQTGTGNAYRVNEYMYTSSISDPAQQFGPVVEESDYDESSTMVSHVDYTYGPEDEILTTRGGTEPGTLSYDANYRAISITDGNGSITTYTYSTQGYLARINYPGSGGATSGSDTIQFPIYDANGDLLSRTDGRGITTDYAYNDSESKLTSVSYPATTSINIAYTYDGFGRKASMTDGTGSSSYAYDDTNRLTSAVTTYTGLAAKTIAYAYYADGSTQAMSTPAGNFGYSYDSDGRMTVLTNPNGETSSWTYLDNSLLATQTLSNGVITKYTFNARGFITDLLSQTSGGTTLSDFGAVTYSGIGDVTAATVAIPSQPTYSGTTEYSYDTISSGGTRSQLTGESSTRIGGYNNVNAYDTAGNPTTLRGSSMASYNSDNQTTASSYGYDGNGNPTTYNSNSLSFDAENRMTAFGSAMTAGYTGDSLRAWKTGSSGTTYYLYNGIRPVCELNSSGSVTAVNTFGANALLSRFSGGSSIFYTFDPQGNVVQRLDSSGNIMDTNAFDAFGQRSSTGASADPYDGFMSQDGYYTDVETGLDLLTTPVLRRSIR